MITKNSVISMFLNIYNKWEEENNKQILSLLDLGSTVNVVDLGCGNGKFSVRIKDRIGCKEIIGVEIWDYGVKNEGLNIVVSDLNNKLPFEDEFFDIVVSNQVLEHLWYPVKFIKEVKRILKKEGIIIISTENLSSLDNIISLIFGWTPFSMEFDEYQKIGNPMSPHNNEMPNSHHPHVRIFTYNGLKNLIENVGFDIVEIRGSGYIPFNFISKLDPKHSRFLTIKARK